MALWNRTGSGGIAIFFSKHAKLAWENAGNPEPILGGPAPDHARFMGVQLPFKTEKIVHKFFLVTAYHPHSGTKDTETIEGFYDSLDSFISQAPRGHIVLMGCDANASIGTTTTDDETSILGKHGVETKKDGDCEFHLTNLLHAHGLKSMATCFEHHRYDTHTSNLNGARLQLDHWFVQDEMQTLPRPRCKKMEPRH
jgi:hypothetical protein